MTVAISGTQVAERLNQAIPGVIIGADTGSVTVPADRAHEVALFLRDDPELDCKFLNCLTALDWVSRYEIVYHLSSMARNHSLVFKARLDHERPVVPSVSDVWMGAHLQEREAYDLMGIIFMGHPSLKRIFLWDGFPGHPLRKDFLALPGGYKPGLQRFPNEFPGGQRSYPAMAAQDPNAPAVPRLDAAPAATVVPTGAGSDPALAGGTDAAPGDSLERSHAGPSAGENAPGAGASGTNS